MIKKVAIIYSGGKYWGGIETLTSHLFKYYPKEKVNLIFFSLGEWPLTKKIRDLGGQTVVYNKTRIQPFMVIKMAKEAKKQGISLFVSGGIVADSYGRAASLFSGIPHLSTIHSSFNNDYPHFLKRTIYKVLVALTSWKTSHYITVSEYLKNQIVKKGVGPKKVSVVYNGVILEKHNIKKEKPTQNELTVTSIGRLHPVKGFDLLIESMKEVNETKLFIFGEGSEKEKLQGKIDQSHLGGRVKLAGFASDTVKVFEDTDIYVQSSLSEGFGLGVVEAMLYGLPIVVTPCGSLPEIIEDGKTGLVSKSTDPKDIAFAINRLISDPKLRQTLAEGAHNVAAKRFDINKWAQNTIEVYLKVAK